MPGLLRYKKPSKPSIKVHTRSGSEAVGLQVSPRWIDIPPVPTIWKTTPEIEPDTRIG